jgi:hypothetical protein
MDWFWGIIEVLSLMFIFFVLGLIIYIVIKKVLIIPAKALGLYSKNQTDVDGIHIRKNHLVIDSVPYTIAAFWGGANSETLNAFQDYLPRGLAERTPEKLIDSGRFQACIHSQPNEKVASYMSIKLLMMLLFSVAFLVAGLKLTKHIPEDTISFEIPLVLFLLVEVYSLYNKPYRTLYYPKWECTGQRLSINGIFNTRDFFLYDINSLELTLIPYTFQFNILLKDGTKLSIKNKKLVNLLPLYDCIVHYRPELKYQQDEINKMYSELHSGEVVI